MSPQFIYTTQYGEELFNCFCHDPETIHISIHNFKSLPKKLQNALFGITDKHLFVSIIPILKLLPYVQEIAFTELDVKSMISDGERYIDIILEYIEKAKEVHNNSLKTLSFTSKLHD
eukprot:161627_1